MPSWVRTLQHYSGSESRKAYVNALKEIRQQLGEDMHHREKFPARAGGIPGREAIGEVDPPSLQSLVDYQPISGKGRVRDATLEKSFWPLLERPVLIAWKVILEGCGEFIQKAWAENVVAPTKGLSELEQAEFLYGPQGKVREFVDKFVKPFLTDNESRLAQSLGEEVPLAPSFLKDLAGRKAIETHSRSWARKHPIACGSRSRRSPSSRARRICLRKGPNFRSSVKPKHSKSAIDRKRVQRPQRLSSGQLTAAATR